ncbi:MAG: hypothetical protein M5R41_00475 [Bacteroidia bacterium]|nr:hypothetical protein [Bacteroidia bacterium]
MRKILLPLLPLLLLIIPETPAYAQPQRLMAFGFYYAPPPMEAGRAAPVYQGLAVSSDRGVTWSNRGWVTSGVSGVAMLSDGAERVMFLASDYGVLRSSDEGLSWRLLTDWDMPTVTDVAIRDGAIWIATARGVYVSTDRGERWVEKGRLLPGTNAGYVNGITITAREIFLATADGLFRSSDRGSTWIRSGLEGKDVFRIISHPAIPTTFAAISQTEGVWISTDGGWNWESRNSGLRSTMVKCISFSPHERDVILVGTRDAGIFRSTSLGRQWEIAGGGLTNFNITALAFDPDSPDRVYAGSENGSFVSNARGRSWQPFSVRLGYISTILIQ